MAADPKKVSAGLLHQLPHDQGAGKQGMDPFRAGFENAVPKVLSPFEGTVDQMVDLCACDIEAAGAEPLASCNNLFEAADGAANTYQKRDGRQFASESIALQSFFQRLFDVSIDCRDFIIRRKDV